MKQADKVFLTTEADTQNALVNSGEFVQSDDNNVDGAVFSKSDLTINGGGTLTVNSTAHGIVCKDDLKIMGSALNITASEKGIDVNDSVRVAGGSLNVDSGTDGIHCENTEDTEKGYIYIADGRFTITCGRDAFDASGTLTVENGTFILTTGGGSQTVTVSGGQMMPNDRQPSQDTAGDTTEDTSSDGIVWDTSGITEPPEVPQNGQMPQGRQTPDGKFGQGGSRPEKPQGGNIPTPPSGGQTPSDGKFPGGSGNASAATESCKGLKADGAVTISGGTFVLDTADDAVHSNSDVTVTGGKFTISTGDDGFHADGILTVSDGTVNITRSYEGLEGAVVNISGGEIFVTASDDGINAAGGKDTSGAAGWFGSDSFRGDSQGSITINGGSITIDASGDGIDSNGSLTVTGGTVYVNGSVSDGNGALDYDGEGIITGGTVVAVGSSGMAVNFGKNSTQGSILYNLSSAQSAGTEVTLTDENGNVLASFTPTKTFRSVVISAPGVEVGNTYTLTVGSQTFSVTMDSVVYGTGSGGFGGFGKR